jgi:hypothetical protein
MENNNIWTRAIACTSVARLCFVYVAPCLFTGKIKFETSVFWSTLCLVAAKSQSRERLLNTSWRCDWAYFADMKLSA